MNAAVIWGLYRMKRYFSLYVIAQSSEVGKVAICCIPLAIASVDR